MESRDLPELVKAIFGGRPQLSVKTLTSDMSATLLQQQHNLYWRVSMHFRAPELAHSILRFASQNYYCKSRIPDPDPCLSGGLGQP
jgi:hypothetical protein